MLAWGPLECPTRPYCQIGLLAGKALEGQEAQAGKVLAGELLGHTIPLTPLTPLPGQQRLGYSPWDPRC
jgi:hypothetical protein